MGEEEAIDVLRRRRLSESFREGESTPVRYGTPIVRNWSDAVRCVVT